MNNRRKLVIAIGAGAIAAPFASIAQQQGKVWRIGYLSPRPGIESQDEAFRQGLRELRYLEGQNIVIEWRFAKGKAELLPGFAAELVRLNVDCIVSAGINATRAAMQATKTIPIVIGNSNDDPVQLGLVASFARPGGNVTGFVSISSELAGKRLELLKVTLPKASRIAILWDTANRSAAGYVRETEAAARVLGVQLQSLAVRNPEDLEDAFRATVKGRAQALVVVGTGFFNSHRERIVSLVAKSRLPAMFSGVAYVLAGGLMGYGPDPSDQYRRAATYVDKILKGAKPADLPIQQPTKFELIINGKTAKAIGLTIPQSLLISADKVIE